MALRSRWRDEVDEVEPGHINLRPDSSLRAIKRAFQHAKVIGVSFEPTGASCAALRDASRRSPTVQLRFFGRYGDEIDGDLGFLDGFDHLEGLSLGLRQVRRIDGLRRLRALKQLSIESSARPSLEPISGLHRLTRLHVGGAAKEAGVVGGLPNLRELSASSSGGLVEGLRGHGSLERLSLHFGTEIDLSGLQTVPALLDLEIWQLRKLNGAALEPVGRIPRLRGLSLGAARNVETLEPLTAARETLRYLALEKVPSLDTLRPVSDLHALRACSLYESRPADSSLEPFHDLPEFSDLTVGDTYPHEQRAALRRAKPDARLFLRGDAGSPDAAAPRLGWRGFFRSIDADVAARRLG